MKWHTLSANGYGNYRYNLTVKLEGVVYSPYLDTARPPVPTIGIGYNLEVHLGTVLRAIVGNAHWSQTLQNRLQSVIESSYSPGDDGRLEARLDNVMRTWHDTRDSGVPTTFEFGSSGQVKTVLNQIGSSYEDVVTTKLGDIPASKERAALYSLAYNSPSLIGPKLTAAIQDGDRAEAWYEIRYNSNGGDSTGIANRRYVEANRFDLFDNDGRVGRAEAMKVGRMFTDHRDDILAYESQFDPISAAHTKGERGIVSIYDEYAVAVDRLQRVFGIDAAMHLEEMQIAHGPIRNLAGDGSGYDSADNDQDLLIGSRAQNRLVGGDGGDALIGLGRNDVLIGGNGADWLDGGNGRDALRGGNGPDTLLGGNGPDALVGGKGADSLDGGAGNDVMRGGPGADSYVVSNVRDRIIEHRGNGDDTLHLDVAMHINARNIEHLVIDDRLVRPAKVVANDLTSVDLSDGRDKLVLIFNRIEDNADHVTISTGRGADRIGIAGPADWSDWSDRGDPGKTFQFTDLKANDRINIRPFDVQEIITGQETTSLDSGLVLMGPRARVVYTDSHGDKQYIQNASTDWVIASIEDPGGDTFGPAFHGNITAGMFLI